MNYNYRYETKFTIADLNCEEIEYIIKNHPAKFSPIFSKRKINNIYFDSPDYTSFIDNIEGNNKRKKIRIRWYGKLFGICSKPILEAKYKHGFLGWKTRYTLNNFMLNFNKNLNYKNIFKKSFKNKSNDIKQLDIDSLIPTLLNCYERIYFLSKDKKYRITLDNNMRFYSINPIKDQFKLFLDQNKNILELKYNHNHRENAEKITNYFPFRVTKSSKYVIGLERIKNW